MLCQKCIEAMELIDQANHYRDISLRSITPTTHLLRDLYKDTTDLNLSVLASGHIDNFLFYQDHSDIIAEVQKKLENLYYPKGFSGRPVLIHAGGVHEDVMHSNFFTNIIDFGQLLGSVVSTLKS